MEVKDLILVKLQDEMQRDNFEFEASLFRFSECTGVEMTLFEMNPQ